MPVYIPTIVISGVTISCIFAANILNKHHQTVITSAYAMLDQYYKNYKKCLKEVYGDEADTKIKAKIAEEVYIHSDDILGENSVYIPENDRYEEMILFYEEYSKTYFRATYAAVINAQYHFNRNLALRAYVTLNEFYGFLGIDKVENGDVIGWSLDDLIECGYGWFDFNNHFTKFNDGLECYIIEYMYMPEPLWSIDPHNLQSVL